MRSASCYESEHEDSWTQTMLKYFELRGSIGQERRACRSAGTKVALGLDHPSWEDI